MPPSHPPIPTSCFGHLQWDSVCKLDDCTKDYNIKSAVSYFTSAFPFSFIRRRTSCLFLEFSLQNVPIAALVFIYTLFVETEV